MGCVRQDHTEATDSVQMGMTVTLQGAAFGMSSDDKSKVCASQGTASPIMEIHGSHMSVQGGTALTRRTKLIVF